MISKKSKLLSLNPFLDEDLILRVGGRLKNSNIPDDSKHQWLLPASHSFAQLLIRSEHIRLLHAGAQSLLYNIRERFWIIGGRSLCKRIVRQCVRCVRTHPKTMSQIMGCLPKERVTPSRPFENVGIDYCGPFRVKNKIRSRVEEKNYISIFICFSTKAVHMEVVTDLSTEAFLAAFRRFVGRRGLCSNVYSDNATNFVGAKSELQELHRLFTSESHRNEITRFCTDRNIQWHTIPPRSPHFGGLWEAAVKSAKFHLKRVVGSGSLTFEQLNTLVVEVESCLNSRPIAAMSEDPNDLTCLSPGHFLIGQPITSLPDPSVRHLSFNRLSHYQKLQWMFQNFWDRWSKEYLGELQRRRKWCQVETEPKLNEVVILQEDNLPPLKWPLARIVELHRGNDGYVRVVTVRVAGGKFRRAITRICPLPFESGSASLDK